MTDDTARNMKARMRVDLRAALKDGRTGEVRLIRALVAAIDNAEAPPLQASRTDPGQHRFRDGSAEVDRLRLGPDEVRSVLMAEIEELEHAAADMNRLDRPDRADSLRADAMIARRYLE